ncbi:LysR family transcriptional regulator [Hephaestia sp. GCM10023244]|uniref:LysR family transcriptional regulator n=1 Tax=unclassified Hephaestia TaxID=2631281 RepID=UPI002076F9EF|nr:LysR family transcriptional regulator [Hephaestia sp. MAHUQ-44]MCM8732511.1 LysR family transcriptional regulator [Hephaestia sp. MAHUQ-44]
MDRLDAMALFVTAVDEGSLAAAARRHRRSPAAVSRAVTMLEELARTTLLLRSTRRLSLTPAGAQHVATWREVLLKLDDIGAERDDTALGGEVVFTASELFGRLAVMPVVEQFMQKHPEISVRAILDNRIVSLVGEGVDVAIRLAHLPDSTLTAIRIGQVRVVYCASPEYLEVHGRPEVVRDLERHMCIGLSADSDAELWPFRAAAEHKGSGRSVRVQTRLSVSNQAAVIDAALRGQGIICAQSYQVVDHLVAGRLVSVLAEVSPAPVPAHVVFQANRAKRGARRAFIEHIVTDLKRELQRIEARLPGQ